jgi:hypothetical protein
MSQFAPLDPQRPDERRHLNTITPVLSVSALAGHSPTSPSAVSVLPMSPTTPVVIAPAAMSNGPPSASLEPADQSGKNGHQRVYQACIPCRRRKVRCDLGPVDNPMEPPCARCKRESKDCFFSATRRKRKNEDVDDPAGDADDYLVRNGRKRVYAGSTPPASATMDRSLYNDLPLTPGGSAGRSQPLRKPAKSRQRSDSSDMTANGGDAAAAAITIEHDDDLRPSAPEETNTQLENLEAQNVMRRGMYGPHDALDLLYKAATDGPALDRHPSSAGLAAAPPEPFRDTPATTSSHFGHRLSQPSLDHQLPPQPLSARHPPYQHASSFSVQGRHPERTSRAGCAPTL